MHKWRLAGFWILVTALTSPLCAQKWAFVPEKKGLKLAMVGEPVKPGASKSNSVLILQCRPGNNGTMSVMYRVNDTKKIPDFHFSDFEGLDAPASKKNLFSVKVDSPQTPVLLQASIAGWYVFEDDFLFSFTTLHGRNADMKRFMEAIQKAANKITVQVRDSRNPKKTLQTTFPAPTDLIWVRKTLSGCF